MSRAKLIKALLAAYDRGSLSLSEVCPSCMDYMGSFNHGVCGKCAERCGCSFNPTSSGDFCDFHIAGGEFARVKRPTPTRSKR